MSKIPPLPAPLLGHNHPPEPADPNDVLDLKLAQRHRGLVVRFIELELACGRVPEPLESEDEAGAVTDFIAQCQLHIKEAEAAHKEEKEFFLKGGRIVDAFFKPRCQKLAAALAPVAAALKLYRDQLAERERQRHAAARQASEAAALDAAAEEAALREVANRLLADAASPAERLVAAEKLLLADAAAARGAAARRAMSAKPEPTHVCGDYGSTAYVRKSWSFEVVDLAQVPRGYLVLDGEAVRRAIVKEGIRSIPGLRIFQSEVLRVRGAA